MASTCHWPVSNGCTCARSSSSFPSTNDVGGISKYQGHLFEGREGGAFPRRQLRRLQPGRAFTVTAGFACVARVGAFAGAAPTFGFALGGTGLATTVARTGATGLATTLGRAGATGFAATLDTVFLLTGATAGRTGATGFATTAATGLARAATTGTGRDGGSGGLVRTHAVSTLG